jgi:thiol-disulfide isomerase/thioredoxin
MLRRFHFVRTSVFSVLYAVAATVVVFWGATWMRAAATPDITLTNLDGRAHSLAEYSGKVVVLNFWATWCLPCREELPMLSKLAPRYAEKEVVFLAASLDDAQTRSKIPRFLQKKKITLAVFTGVTSGVLKEFQLGEIIPATLILESLNLPLNLTFMLLSL